jgi:hypothetical protein
MLWNMSSWDEENGLKNISIYTFLGHVGRQKADGWNVILLMSNLNG